MLVFTHTLKSIVHVMPSLQRQKHVVVFTPHLEAWIDRLPEVGAEGVDVTQVVRWDIIEGQSASRPVQVHSQSGAASGRNRELQVMLIIICIQMEFWWRQHVAKTPGLGIPSKLALITISFPWQPYVANTHSYISMITTAPLHLPVTAPSQSLSAQNLTEKIKSLRVVRIRLWFSGCGLLVSLRQNEVFVCCVWVQSEITGVWWREQDVIMITIQTQFTASPPRAATGVTCCCNTDALVVKRNSCILNPGPCLHVYFTKCWNWSSRSALQAHGW